MKKVIYLFLLMLFVTACTENYSSGERIGVITKWSEKGLIWKSWEGSLNITQTGMNTSGDPFEFSMDNDRPNYSLRKLCDSAANKGWKVKITYREVKGWNVAGNRGCTDHFIQRLDIIDRTFTDNFKLGSAGLSSSGKVVDTIYVVIVDKARLK